MNNRLLNPSGLLLAALFSVTALPVSAIAGTYSVSGDVILHDGEEINLFGVNWFGLETTNHTPHGLWSRNYKDMITQIRQLGFNAVRVPFCPATVRNAPASAIDYSKNPDLQGLGGLEIMDVIVAELDRQGLYVLLDHHRPDCNAISELWYVPGYSESDWIDDLSFLADRYRGVEHFVGIDLKNEPHGAATWGTGNAATDWDQAAARAARAILDVNPDILIIVEGIQENPSCSSNTNHWWGGNLEPQACAPLQIPDDKLVFSPHVYGPDVFDQPYFSDATFPDNMPAIWDQHFGFLADQGRVLAPGEFGGKYGHGGDARDVAWQNSLIDYFVDKRICNFFYWSWNPNSGDTGGILKDDWNNVWQDKVDNLGRLMSACGASTIPACDDGIDNDNDGLIDLDDPGCDNASDNNEYDAPPAKTQCDDGVDNDGDNLIDLNDPGCTDALDDDERNPPPGVELSVTLTTTDDWGSGYCANGEVTNNTDSAVDWKVIISPEGTIRDFWNGNYQVVSDGIEVRGAPWNATLQAGASTVFGFCAERTAPPPPPRPACDDGIDNDGDGRIDLQDPGCSSATDDDETDPVKPPPPGGDVVAELSVQSDWGSGYCADVLIRNPGSVDVDWVVTFPIEGSAYNVWNAIGTEQGGKLTLTGLSWNNIVPAGATLESIGFCANR